MSKIRINIIVGNLFINMKYYYLLLILCKLLHVSNCLFEDQVGKFDWKKNFIGKFKYSHIETHTNLKKIIIATEENVLAALNHKSGDICWRNVFENDSRGIINFLHVDKEIITITGESPYNIRGWDISNGFLLWEWSLQLTNRAQSTYKPFWFVTNSTLYHVLPDLSSSHIELTQYDLTTGNNRHGTQRISTPWINNRCVLSNNYLVCPQNQNIIGLNILEVNMPRFEANMGSQIVGDIEIIKGTLPSILINKKLVKIDNNAFVQTSMTKNEDETMFTVLINDEEFMLRSYIDQNKVLQLFGNTKNGQESIRQSIAYPQNFSTPKIADVLCLQKGQNYLCNILYHTEDNVLFLRAHDKIAWYREEALSQIIAVRMIDLPLTEDCFQNAIPQAGNFLDMFKRRLLQQVTHLKSFLISIFGMDVSSSHKGHLVRDSFGLHKIIVVVTSVGKIFGIDNIDATIHWTRYIPDMAKKTDEFHLELIEQRTTKYFPHAAQCTIVGNKVNKNGFIFQFNPINGKDIENGLFNLPYVIRQYALLPENEDFLKGLLILDDNNVPHVYPKKSEGISVGTYMYSIRKQSGIATGFIIENSKDSLVALPIWSLQLTMPDHVVSHIAPKSLIERVNSQGRVLSDRSVLYKYLNPNLVAIITHGPDLVHKYIMNVILLDVVSGKIISSASHIRAKEPVHIVHSENWLVYSYFNDKSRRTEIGTIELYEGKSQPNTTLWSSFKTTQPIIEKQSYIFPAQVEALRETITIRGITAKHVLIGTSFGSILEMPWIFLDPRRPVTIAGEARDEGVLSYMPELPMPSEGIINYNKSIERIKDIIAVPSGLESTCLVLVHGLDIFYTRVAPSQTFDLLKEDFDYWMIMIVLSVLMVTVFITKHLANRKTLWQAWH